MSQPHPGSELGSLETDVVIVGAGLAGLMAARRLTEAGIAVLVPEAHERVGGRTYTRPASDGTLLDLGGQWVGPTQHRLPGLGEGRCSATTTDPSTLAKRSVKGAVGVVGGTDNR